MGEAAVGQILLHPVPLRHGREVVVEEPVVTAEITAADPELLVELVEGGEVRERHLVMLGVPFGVGTEGDAVIRQPVDLGADQPQPLIPDRVVAVVELDSREEVPVQQRADTALFGARLDDIADTRAEPVPVIREQDIVHAELVQPADRTVETVIRIEAVAVAVAIGGPVGGLVAVVDVRLEDMAPVLFPGRGRAGGECHAEVRGVAEEVLVTGGTRQRLQTDLYRRVILQI